MLSLKSKCRAFYKSFICLKGDPRKIAMGMAIGVFIGVTPTIPLHTVLSIAVIFLFRQNLTAALLGIWINNPLTIPVFYFTEYEIGRYILGWERYSLALNSFNIHDLFRIGWEIFYPLQVGGLIIAPFFAVPAYFITYKALLVIRRRGLDADCERTAEKI